MQDAQHVEIGLGDRVDKIADELRHIGAEPREIPSHHDGEGEGKIGEGERDHHRRIEPARQTLRAAERAPGAEHEQQLPSEGIEHPHALRIGGDVPAEIPGQRIEHRRQRECQRRRAQ